MAADVLTDAALNRATLARQLLLHRSSMAPVDAVTHLVGLQAQNPLDPYLALWSRLEGFDADAVGRLVLDRALVRIVVIRGTIHLVTAEDAAVLRPLAQPVLDAEIARHSDFAEHLVGVDVAPVLALAREVLTAQPMTGTQLRAVLAENFPHLHAAALAYACRCHLPLVQVPPRGVWGATGAVRSTPLEAWTGRPLAIPSIDDAIVRYLASFGPATPADAATWSRLTGMREVFERLRPRLRVFRDARGRELFDLPDAPRPAGQEPAPVRLLPEYDNLLLSHADRSRFEAAGSLRGAAGPVKGTALVDGRVSAVWHTETTGGASTMVVEHVELPRGDVDTLEREAWDAARFWHGRGPVAAAVDVQLRTLD